MDRSPSSSQLCEESDSQRALVEYPQNESLIPKGEAWMFGFEIDAVGIGIGVALMVVLEISFLWGISGD
jgi:hypothetical protein